LLHNALRSEKWKTATVVDLLPKRLLSGGNPEDSGFVDLCRDEIFLTPC